jgi:non-specific serine/threonine protein kinase
MVLDHLPHRAADLPAPLTSLVGREREIVAFVEIVRRPGVRLVTLTGPGGVGKTRLALAMAGELGSEFADGAAFVPLAQIRDPALVVSAIARALGVRESGDGPLLLRLTAALADRDALLILDNLEQVLAAATDVAAMLAACPRLKIVVTSRAVLGISGEHTVVVPPLPHGEAMTLFAARAQGADHGFALTEENARDVAAICDRLDGLPLAIELAAARVRVLPLKELVPRLTERLRLLTEGPRDQPPRLRSMRDAIAWSYELLAPSEQALFRRLSVFVGGCTLEAVKAVCGDAGSDVLDGIAALVQQSLLQRVESGEGTLRFAMLETIREFGLEMLAAGCEAEESHRRHATYFARLVEPMTAPALVMTDPQLNLARLDADYANFRAAIVWVDEHGEIETLLRLVAGLEVYWCLRGHLREGRGWLERALLAGANAPTHLRAAALLAAGWVARDQGDLPGAEAFGQQSRTMFRAAGATAALAEALILLGNVAGARGNLTQAQAFHEEALDLLDCTSEPFWRAVALRHLGWLSYLRGDTEEGERRLMETLALCQRTGNSFVAVKILSNLATIALARGECDQAAARWRDRLDLSWDARGVLWSLEGLAEVAAAFGEHHGAARLWGAADACRERLGIARLPAQAAAYEASTALARAGLDEAVYAAAWAVGRSQPLDQVVAEAKALAVDIGVAPHRQRPTRHGLTARELEVLRLVVEGQTNPEIAADLFISQRTARAHVAAILAKFGVPTRAAAATYALRHHLV